MYKNNKTIGCQSSKPVDVKGKTFRFSKLELHFKSEEVKNEAFSEITEEEIKNMYSLTVFVFGEDGTFRTTFVDIEGDESNESNESESKTYYKIEKDNTVTFWEDPDCTIPQESDDQGECRLSKNHKKLYMKVYYSPENYVELIYSL